MPYPKKADDWIKIQKLPTMTPKEVGVRLMALYALLTRDMPQLMTEAFLPGYRQGIDNGLNNDHFTILDRKIKNMSLGGVAAMIKLDIYNAIANVDDQSVSVAGAGIAHTTIFKDYIKFDYKASVPHRNQLAYDQRVQKYIHKFIRVCENSKQELFTAILDHRSEALMVLIKYVDQLLNEVVAFTGHKQRYRRTADIQNDLVKLGAIMDSVANSCAVTQSVIMGPEAYHAFIGLDPDKAIKEKSITYSPQNGPVTPEQMLWLMDAFEYHDQVYKSSKMIDPQMLEYRCYLRLKNTVRSMIGDVSHLRCGSIGEWTFDPNDYETVRAMKTRNIHISNLFGYIRFFYQGYKDKLAESTRLAFANDIDEYLYAYHHADDEALSGAMSLIKGSHEPKRSVNMIKSLLCRDYKTPDIDEILQQIHNRANGDFNKESMARKIQILVERTPEGMRAVPFVHIRRDPEIVALRRRIFERGSRSQSIPEIKQAFIKAVAQEQGDEIVRYLKLSGVANVDQELTRMQDQGRLPLDAKGRPIISVDHRHDLDAGGLNLMENFVLVPGTVNAAKNNLKALQAALAIDEPAFWQINWVPENSEAKIVFPTQKP